MGQLAREVPISSAVTDYVVRLTLATHPEAEQAPPDVVRRYVRYGVSPRGAQAIVLGAKIRALMEGRLNVAFEDVRAVVAAGTAPPADPQLRRRILGDHRRRDHRRCGRDIARVETARRRVGSRDEKTARRRDGE